MGLNKTLAHCCVAGLTDCGAAKGNLPTLAASTSGICYVFTRHLRELWQGSPQGVLTVWV